MSVPLAALPPEDRWSKARLFALWFGGGFALGSLSAVLFSIFQGAPADVEFALIFGAVDGLLIGIFRGHFFSFLSKCGLGWF